MIFMTLICNYVSMCKYWSHNLIGGLQQKKTCEFFSIYTFALCHCGVQELNQKMCLDPWKITPATVTVSNTLVYYYIFTKYVSFLEMEKAPWHCVMIES